MTKHIAAFVSGLGLAVLIGMLRESRFDHAAGEQVRRAITPAIDLNLASSSDFRELGFDDATIDRIIESRPYRSTLELVSRVMVPGPLFAEVKHRLTVSDTDEAVKIAS